MTPEEREQIEKALNRISRNAWEEFLSSNAGEDLRLRLEAVSSMLREAGLSRPGAPPKPVSDVIDLLGHNLLSDDGVGRWLRKQILMGLPRTRWEALVEFYREHPHNGNQEVLHGNATQHGRGSAIMSARWRQGGRWARALCTAANLPDCLWQRRRDPLPDNEEILPVVALPALHDFQTEVYTHLRTSLRQARGSAAIMSLPTGAGKTRVAVEAICDHIAEDADARERRPLVLWLAQSEELLRQAWDTFRQVWQVPPARVPDQAGHGRRPVALHLVRAWGSMKFDDLGLARQDVPTVLLAGVPQLHSWVRDKRPMADLLPADRMSAVVIDEAHRVVNDQHAAVLKALRLRDHRFWRPLKNAPPIFGLTATPWRSDTGGNHSLMSFFEHTLYTPARLGGSPILELQHRGILSKVTSERLQCSNTLPLTEQELSQYHTFGDLPGSYLRRLGRVATRNAKIVRRLLRLPKQSRALVFCCSVTHAELLTLALNRSNGGGCAALVTADTPRAERVAAIERFRNGQVRFLCNVGVLTTGFDAPATDVVCVARPTTSTVLYEQMIGRGLRGPLNGGTDLCRVIDVQDDGLPQEILSYERVMDIWQAPLLQQ